MPINLNSLRPIDILEAAMFIFLASGLKGSQLAQALDNLFKALTGFSALRHANFQPAITETALTPAEIAKAVGMSGNKKSTRTINYILEDAQYQKRLAGKGNWMPTEKGNQFAVIIDTGKKYPDGSPILQLKWKPAIVLVVQKLIPF